MTFFNHPCCLSLGLRFAKLVDARLLAERSHRGYRFNVQIEEVFQDYGIIYGGFLNWWTPKSPKIGHYQWENQRSWVAKF
jgi:hypothetical protein